MTWHFHLSCWVACGTCEDTSHTGDQISDSSVAHFLHMDRNSREILLHFPRTKTRLGVTWGRARHGTRGQCGCANDVDAILALLLFLPPTSFMSPVYLWRRSSLIILYYAATAGEALLLYISFSSLNFLLLPLASLFSSFFFSQFATSSITVARSSTPSSNLKSATS